MNLVSATGIIFAATYAAFGQSAPATPSFEVASIKAAPPPADGRLMIRMGGDAGRLDYTNVSLKDLLRNAYKVRESQIDGPEWLGSERYNLVAKLPEGASKDQAPAMLQTLLAERFKLALHKEKKVVPAYVLLVGKSGCKLHPAEGEGRLRMMMGPKGRHLSGVVTLQSLADAMSNFMDRPVVDMTGIKGNFDLDLEWSGDDASAGRALRGPGGPGGSEGGPRPEGHDESADAPSIFTSLDKLGLKLDPRKESVDILIIDHAEKVPTEN